VVQRQLNSGVAECTKHVQKWVDKTVLGLGLCPWASRAAAGGAVRYLSCLEERPVLVARFLRAEAKSLCCRSSAPWATSLVVCPRVAAWNSDFKTFDAWVSKSPDLDDLEDLVALVAFHPAFRRWHALADHVSVGSVVLAHFEEEDGERSRRPLQATVVTTDAAIVGARRVGVRFLDDGTEQWVPSDWLVGSAHSEVPLPDNWMHRAPHPTVHLIRRCDLNSIRESAEGYEVVADVQLRNSSRLATLGWDKLSEIAHSECTVSSGGNSGSIGRISNTIDQRDTRSVASGCRRSVKRC